MTQKIAANEVKAKNSGTDTRPEVELLLCCARTHLDTSTAERLRDLLQEDIDWDYLLRLARQHKMMPLLYWHLNLTCSEAVPKATLELLQKHFNDNAQRNQFLTLELLKLLNLFEKQGIPAIPFKGPVLAASVYDNLALRHFSDLDILVKKQDFLKAKDLLLSHGYYSTKKGFLTEAQRVAVMQNWGEYSLASHDGRVEVDLHQRLVAGYLFTLSADLDHFWERLEPVSLLGQTVLSFQTEETLLYLCIHGTKSFWQRMSWICDVAELINTHQKLDWEQLIEHSQTLGCERMLLLGCFLASDLLRTKLPEEIYSKIDADGQIKSLATRVTQRLRGKTKYPHQGEYTLASFIFHFKAMERLEDKFRYSLKCFVDRSLFPLRRIVKPNAGDREFFPLPRPLYFLYYLIRPIRLVVKYGSMVMKQKSVG